MSEVQGAGLDRPARPTVADGPVAAGAMLRQAREAAGVHLASLATSLKVPAGRLEALETGRIDLLPDPTFARALAASMCRSLRIDADPVLQLLPRTSTALSAAELAATRAPFRSDATSGGRARSGGLSKPIGVVVVLLLLATAALIFAPDFGWQLPGMPGRGADVVGRSTERVASRGADNAALTAEPSVTGNALKRPAPEPVVAKPAAGALVGAVPTSAIGSAMQASGATAPVASAQRPTASGAAMTAAVAPPSPPAPTAALATAVPSQQASTGATIQIETVVPAWVQVLDASGAALVKRTVAAGETVKLNSESLPLKVTIGHSNKTKVQVRGESYDMDPVSRGGVARFQVK